jgi:hypothetical protein
VRKLKAALPNQKKRQGGKGKGKPKKQKNNNSNGERDENPPTAQSAVKKLKYCYAHGT